MFDHIIGNKEIKEKLTHLIQSNNISHSYSFIGPEGIGKKLFAIEFAKQILCLNKTNKSCNECDSCKKFMANNHPDFEIIIPDGKAIKVEQIRNATEKMIEKPIISDHKIYIFDESETMTPQAQNSLLKTLEEPPKFMTLILIASNENSLLTTIKSRCIKTVFKRLTDNEMKSYIQEHKEIDHISDEMIKICGGSIAKANTIDEKMGLYQNMDEILKKLKQNSLIDILSGAETIYKAKDQIQDILEYMNIYFYYKALENLQNDKQYLNCINLIEQTKKNLLANSNFEMSIDNLLIRLWEEVNHEKYNRSKVQKTWEGILF